MLTTLVYRLGAGILDPLGFGGLWGERANPERWTLAMVLFSLVGVVVAIVVLPAVLGYLAVVAAGLVRVAEGGFRALPAVLGPLVRLAGLG
jgi:hypothetical protein